MDEKEKDLLPKQTKVYGTPVPAGKWFGIGILEEFRDGKGEDDDSE